MKSLTLLSVTVLTLMTIGCEKSSAQNKKYGNHQISEGVLVQSQNNSNNNDQNFMANSENTQASSSQINDQEEVMMHPVMNAQTGEPSMYIPFPSSWKFIKGAELGQPALNGPNGLSVIIYPPQGYIYTNDPYMNQSYQANGMEVMAPSSVENIMTQLIIPQGQQMGMTLINQYSMPEMAAKDREFSDKLLGSNQQDIFHVIGTDWKDRDGNKALVVLHYYERRSNGIINWGYNAEKLQVQPAKFEQAKKQYAYGMANRVFNQNEVNAFNKELAGKLKAQNDHADAIRTTISEGSGQRLADNAATNEHIRQSKIEGYENRTHNNDVAQEQINHALTDISVVVSPYDGKEYQIEAGHKTYWINNEGKFIKSDDPLFDPNKYEDHPGVWQKAAKKVYK